MPAAAFAVFVSQWRGATMNASDSTTTSCCVCCKEIPLDAAFTPEGAEYVEHFCGLECYQRFEARAKTGSIAAASTICSSVGTTAKRPGWPGCANRPSNRIRGTCWNTSNASKRGRRSTCLLASSGRAPEPPAQDRP